MSHGAAPCCCRPSPRWRAWQVARPLALIEVGASAGLNLLFDRYGYDYGAGRSAGDPSAPVRFTCALRGAVLAADPRGAAARDHPRRH